MKKLITILFFLLSFCFVNSANALWYSSNYDYKREITINSSQVDYSTSTFPVLASTTQTYLKHSNHSGGKVENANGYDIIFVDDDDTTLLDFEIEKYATSTGALKAWVSTDVSSTTNTTFYMYYGNSSATDISSSTAVWADTGAVGIWHMSEGEGSTIYDSTSNDNDRTITGADWVADGLDFVAVNTDYVELGDINEIESSSFSITIKFKLDSLGTDENIITKANSHGLRRPLLIWYDVAAGASYPTVGGGNTNAISVMVTDNTETMHWIATPSNSVDTNPHILTVTFDQNTDRLSAYLDGVLEATYIQTSAGIGATADNLIIGSNGSYSHLLDGIIGFNYIYNRALSTEEISTQYNNTDAPSTFITIGSEETETAGTPSSAGIEILIFE